MDAAASLACPACRAALPPAPLACPACELPLTGPYAGHLWQVDLELAAMGRRHGVLQAERDRLLGLLRDQQAGQLPPAPAVPLPQVSPGPYDTLRVRQPVGPEWTPARVQNLLLGLGGLLLAVAAVVFAVVSWGRLGVGGRATVLLGVTALAAWAPAPLTRRGLRSTAETVAAVALLLGALDLWAARATAVFGLDRMDGLAYLSAGCAVLAAAAGAYAVAVPVRGPRFAAVGLAQLAALAAVGRLDVPADASALLLGLVSLVDVGVLALARPGRGVDDVRAALLAATVGMWGLAALAAVPVAVAGDLAAGVSPADRRAAAVVLLVIAAVPALTAVLVVEPLRTVAAAAAAAALAVGTVGVLLTVLARSWQPVAPAAVATVLLLGTLALPVAWRTGPVAVGAGVLALPAAAVSAPALAALAGPLDDAARGWAAGVPADPAASVGFAAGLVVPAVVVLVAAGAATALAGHGRVRAAVAAAAGLGVVAAPTLPLAAGFPYAAVVGTSAALTLAAVTGTLALDRGAASTPGWTRAVPAVAVVALLLLVHTLSWALRAPAATLLVTTLGTVVAAALAALCTDRDVAAGAAATATLLTGATATAATAAAGWAPSAVGLALLAPAALAAAVAALLRRAEPTGRSVETAAAVLAVTGVGLTADDPGRLALALALVGAGLLTVAVRPDRRAAAVAGTVALTASSWVRLADAGVSTVEAYTLPVSLVVLTAGVLRRRSDPRTSSLAAYGPGLSGALLPSLLASLGDPDPLRPLLLATAALAVTLAGAAWRLRAPLLIGGGTLAVVAMDQLAPVAAALPRWVTLGGLGLLLLTVGATYETRRRDLERVRTGIAGMA